MELIILLIVLGFLLCAGVGFAMLCIWAVRLFTGERRNDAPVNVLSQAPTDTSVTAELLRELAATRRQIERLWRAAQIEEATYREMIEAVSEEQARLAARRQTPSPTRPESQPPQAAPQTVVPFRERTTVYATDVAAARESHPQEEVTARLTNERNVVAYVPPAPRAAENISVAPPAPSKPFTEVFASFMEERNIRWGELVGGLLIVGCSVALVVSFWTQISQLPVVKFLLFTSVTAALFGAGLYTEHRWKLPTTSHGLLLISVLLVPLNFLAIAAAGASGSASSSFVILTEAVAPVIFLLLVYYAGRVLVPRAPQLLAFGVLGSSVCQLLVRHFATPDISSALLLALGVAPLICYAGTTLWMLHLLRREAEAMSDSSDSSRAGDATSYVASPAMLDERGVNEILIALGATLFASLLPCALLLFRAGTETNVLTTLAALTPLAGVSLLVAGLTLRRDGRGAVAQTVGASASVFGALVMHAGLALAFPRVGSLIAALLANGILFTLVAKHFRFQILHLSAATCFAAAGLLGYQLAVGNLTWDLQNTPVLSRVLVSASGAHALAIVFVLLILAAEAFKRDERIARGCYAGVAGSVAAFSLLIATPRGFLLDGDPYLLAPLLWLYAAGALWCAWRYKLAALAWCASALALAAFAQTCGAWFGVVSPWQIALLAHATLAFALGIVARERADFFAREGADAIELFHDPFVRSAVISSAVAAALLLVASQSDDAVTVALAARAFWLSALWLAIACFEGERKLFFAAQLAVAVAVCLTMAANLERFAWYRDAMPAGWLHPWALQAQGVALLSLSLAWVMARLATRGHVAVTQTVARSEGLSARLFAAWREFNAGAWSVDRATTGLVLAGFALLTLYGVMPGVAHELLAREMPTRAWDVGNLSHELAGGAGAWALLASLVVAIFAASRERFHHLYVLGAVVLAASLCPLLAMRWESSQAVASAWRWFAAGVLALGSLALWRRDAGVWIKRLFNDTDADAERHARVARASHMLLVCLTVAPLLLLTLVKLLSLIAREPNAAPAILRGVSLESWSYVLPLVIVSFVAAIHAARVHLLRHVYAAGALLNFAVTFWWFNDRWHTSSALRPVARIELVFVNALTLALAGAAWLAVERLLRRRAGAKIDGHYGADRLPPFQEAAVVLASIAITCAVALGLAADASASPLANVGWIGWTTLAAAAALAAWRLMERSNIVTTATLYALGAACLGMALDDFDFAPRRLGVWCMSAMAGYAVVTSYVWNRRRVVSSFIVRRRESFGIRSSGIAGSAGWLPGVNALLAATVVALGIWVCFSFAEMSFRLLAALAVANQMLTFGLAANGDGQQENYRKIALGVGGVAALLFGWAWLDPRSLSTAGDESRALLHYGVVAAVAMFGVAAIYGFILRRIRHRGWADAVKGVLPLTLAAGGAALTAVLVAEVALKFGGAPVLMHPLAIITVAFLLVCAALLCVVFALREDLDPFGLSERGRMNYVYACEALLALLFMHIRLTMPWLFTGFFSRYWSLVVVALAFGGVGLGEVFRRRGRNVLAEPLERTGAVLPLLPVLGFWAVPSEVHFGGLLFLIGLLYGTLSVMRRSFAFAILAVLAGNGALWYVLDHTRGFGLREHPQLWLIPLALSVLVASHLNRERLSAEQTTAIRYSTMVVIYISSTLDIFINGVGATLWLPLVLGALSVAGVLAGIALRVRAFLFLGTAFLCVSLITVIWHASVSLGWTWLWYVAGIALGAGIIFTFALFEKKRREVLHLVDELRAWER